MAARTATPKSGLAKVERRALPKGIHAVMFTSGTRQTFVLPTSARLVARFSV